MEVLVMSVFPSLGAMDCVVYCLAPLGCTFISNCEENGHKLYVSYWQCKVVQILLYTSFCYRRRLVIFIFSPCCASRRFFRNKDQDLTDKDGVNFSVWIIWCMMWALPVGLLLMHNLLVVICSLEWRWIAKLNLACCVKTGGFGEMSIPLLN